MHRISISPSRKKKKSQKEKKTDRHVFLLQPVAMGSNQIKIGEGEKDA